MVLDFQVAVARGRPDINGAPRAKPVVPGLPRLSPRNRTAISGVKSRKFLKEKFLGIRCDEILFNNFVTLVRVIRRRFTRGFALRRTSRRSKNSFAFIHGQSPWSSAKADKSRREESNLRPTIYETVALPTELRRHK